MNTRTTMHTSMKTTLCLALLSAAALGCRPTPEAQTSGDDVSEGSDTGDTGGTSAGEEGTDGEPPGMEGEGPAEHPKARQIARLTADQLYASLRVVTGQEWEDYDEYAAALGKPDLSEVTEQGKSFSVSFDKFVHDAARATCLAAIEADVGAGEGEGDTGGEPQEPVLLRHADASERDHAKYVENLQYLLLRFLAVEVDDPEDSRLKPWLTLLEAPPPEGEDELTDERMAERWWAVCVGLATHPDFLSY